MPNELQFFTPFNFWTTVDAQLIFINKYWLQYLPINIGYNIVTHIIAHIDNNIGNNINTYCDPGMDSKKMHANENCIGS